MRPTLEILPADLIDRIVDEALQLLRDSGVKVDEAQAGALLVGAGATADGDRLRQGR